jgi:hypothetical protein
MHGRWVASHGAGSDADAGLRLGSKQQVLDGLLEMREAACFDGDFVVNLQFEHGAATYDEAEVQMQYFAEEFMLELRRECGSALTSPTAPSTSTPGHLPAHA